MFIVSVVEQAAAKAMYAKMATEDHAKCSQPCLFSPECEADRAAACSRVGR
jgi:hypothetical protein